MVIITPKTNIRPMNAADLDVVTDIEQQVTFDTPWGRKIFEDCLTIGYHCWVIEDANTLEVLGFGLISNAAEEAHILNLCIRNTHHRQGLGSLLFQKLLDLAQAAQVSRVYLEVATINTNAVQFYEHWGFQRIGIRRDYYHAKDGNHDALVMAKSLIQSLSS